MKYCTQCGTQAEDNVRFCPACGQKFENEAPEDVIVVEEQATENVSEDLSWQRKASKIILIISKVVAIVGIVSLALMLVVAIVVDIAEYSYVAEIGVDIVALTAILEIIFVSPILIIALVFIGKTLKMIEENRKMSIGHKICVLIFASAIAGIFLLTESNDRYLD